MDMIPVRNSIGGLGNLMFKQAYLYAQARDGVIPDVYVQDEKYFEKYKDEIKLLFGQDIGFLPYVSVHIRRGDYIGSNFHTNLCLTDYYERAISMFSDDKKFLVFSDDPEWCKSKFTSKNFQIMEGGSEIEDMNLMGSCENNIIANSTFSWWAAYLNPNFNKRIIAPKEDSWFKDGIIRIKLPKEWEQI